MIMIEQRIAQPSTSQINTHIIVIIMDDIHQPMGFSKKCLSHSPCRQIPPWIQCCDAIPAVVDSGGCWANTTVGDFIDKWGLL
jgi:hypothetical protein